MLRAALAIADERGDLGAVTMQAVATRLGVTAMALYRHVASKADLLDGLVEVLLTEVRPWPADLPWADRLTAMAHGIRACAARHPSTFPLLLQRPAATAAARSVRDGALSALAEAGLPPDAAARAERLLSTAVLGFAASEAAGRFARHGQAVRDADFACLLGALRPLVVAAARRAGRGRGRGRDDRPSSG